MLFEHKHFSDISPCLFTTGPDKDFWCFFKSFFFHNILSSGLKANFGLWFHSYLHIFHFWIVFFFFFFKYYFFIRCQNLGKSVQLHVIHSSRGYDYYQGIMSGARWQENTCEIERLSGPAMPSVSMASVNHCVSKEPVFTETIFNLLIAI